MLTFFTDYRSEVALSAALCDNIAVIRRHEGVHIVNNVLVSDFLQNFNLVHQEAFYFSFSKFVKIDHLYGYGFAIAVIAPPIHVARITAT